MDKNTNYLFRTWAVAALFGGLTLAGVVAAVGRGEYLIPVIVVTVIALIFLQRWYVKRKALLFFRDKTPERAVAYYHRTMSRIPNGPPLAAYMSALVLALYGAYDKARDELASVSWASFPPMYDGFRTYVLSIVAILEKKDFQKALDLALEARDLCSVSTNFPGAAVSQRTLEAHVHVCELLNGVAKSATIAALECAAKDLPGIAAVLPAWSLTLHYHRTGQKRLADVHTAMLRRLVPNCTPLLTDQVVRC